MTAISFENELLLAAFRHSIQLLLYFLLQLNFLQTVEVLDSLMDCDLGNICAKAER
jgi:hypothetical protein